MIHFQCDCTSGCRCLRKERKRQRRGMHQSLSYMIGWSQISCCCHRDPSALSPETSGSTSGGRGTTRTGRRAKQHRCAITGLHSDVQKSAWIPSRKTSVRLCFARCCIWRQHHLNGRCYRRHQGCGIKGRVAFILRAWFTRIANKQH